MSLPGIDDEEERIIRKAKDDSGSNKIIEWSKSHGAYKATRPTETQEVVIVETAQEALPYYKENPSEYFDEWDDDLDTVSSYNGAEFDCKFIERIRTVTDKESDYVEPGFYRANYIDHELMLDPIDQIAQDDYIDMELGVKELYDDMINFFDKKEVFDKYNMVRKRSSLLFGPPGTGKSFSAIHLCKKVIQEYDAIVILTPPKDTGFDSLTSGFREPLQDRTTIFMVEELTEAKGKKEEILSFLDGENSWNNSYAIGTTNYPGKLDKNIVDRPGRFDKVIEVDEPDKQERKKYLESVTDRTYTDKELAMTEGYSFSYLKELVLRMELEDKSLETVIEGFEELKREIDDAFQDREDTIGFQ